MQPVRKPWWQQATALVSLSAGGTITGFSFAPGTPAHYASPTSLPVQLMALDKAAQPAGSDDATLRAAIVKVTNYYLQMATSKSPAEMEALIWQQDSLDGADHGESCAAFASMTLELAAQVVGQQSWVTGGSSYPWPLHQWADVRVDPNPDSLGITSIQQDAQAHGRWHPLGDGYQPQPGDWVLFNGHVEVVTEYAGGVLHTVGADSLPNLSVNAHEFSDPLSAQGVAGFVNNGTLASATAATAGQGSTAAGSGAAAAGSGAAAAGPQVQRQAAVAAQASAGQADIPGAMTVGSSTPAIPTSRSQSAGGSASAAGASSSEEDGSSQTAATDGGGQSRPAGQADGAAIPGVSASAATAVGRTAPSASRAASGSPSSPPASSQPASSQRASAPAAGQPSARSHGTAAQNAAAIPGVPAATPSPTASAPAAAPQQASASPAQSSAPYRRHQSSSSSTPAYGTSAQQAFINAVAPAAADAQRRYGVPAAVTIAQAIDESAWGQSQLAAKDNNLFGIKGTGPAGSDALPTQEFLNGQWVGQTAQFRVYSNIAQSIDDHGRLLATSGYYSQAMASRNDPNSFASALTGIYATDPGYGQTLIGLMQRYNLYRYDATSAPSSSSATAQAAPTGTAQAPPSASMPASTPASTPTATPQAASADIPGLTTPTAASATSPQPVPSGAAQTTPAAPQPAPTASQPAPAPSQPAPSRAQPTPTTSQPVPTTAQPTPVSLAPTTPAPRATAPATGAAMPPAPKVTPSAAPRSASATAPQSASATAPRSRPSAASRSMRGTTARPRRTAAAPAVPSPATTGTSSARQARTPVATPARTPAATPARTPAATPARTPVATPAGTSNSPSTARPRPRTAPPSRSAPAAAAPGTAVSGSAAIPGVPNAAGPALSAAPAGGTASTATATQGRLSDFFRAPNQETASTQTVTARLMAMTTSHPSRRAPSRGARAHRTRYKHHIPQPVLNAFVTTARVPLIRAEPLYRDVASDTGIQWELLAACDWMQCKAHPRYSPVHGEKLRTVNSDGTVYRTRSEALAQCAVDLVEFSAAVYEIDLTADEHLSIRDLANVFAAFRWGALLRLHHTSALEFPYSVAGLTAQHVNMRWPDIDEPNAPDKPGARFRQPFGAVPIVLGLGYPATI